MKMKFRAALVATTMLTLAGCGSQSPVGNEAGTQSNQIAAAPAPTGCLSADGQAIAISAITKQVVKQVALDAPTASDQQVPAAVVRNEIDSIGFEIADVRTTAQDDKTTRKSCTGMFRIKLPVSVSGKANEALTTTDSTTIDDLAARYNFEEDSGAYQIALDYSVQPTDDGAKIYAEVKDTQNSVVFLSKIVVSDVYSGRIRLAKQDQDKQQLAMKTEQEQAVVVRDQSALVEATERKRLSVTRINASWDAMPQVVQDRLLVMQRAWNKRRTAECQVQASNSGATGTKPILTARFDCEAIANNARADQFDEITQKTAANSGQ